MNMKGYKANIEELVQGNENFREVVYTAKHSQLVLMSLKPLEEIGFKIHDVDQFFRFESGEGKVLINENEYSVKDGDVVIVPEGARHNVINTSRNLPLKLYTLYCPPHHKDKTVHADKDQAQGDKEHFAGETTE